MSGSGPSDSKADDDHGWYVTLSGIIGDAVCGASWGYAAVGVGDDCADGTTGAAERRLGPSEHGGIRHRYRSWHGWNDNTRAAGSAAQMSMRNRGFTLLELLVAMFIAAIMFAIGYGAINQAVNNHSAVADQQARLVELQTAVRVMEQDFVQLEPRPVRQPVGDGWLPALLGNPDPTAQPMLQLSRVAGTIPPGCSDRACNASLIFSRKTPCDASTGPSWIRR